MCILVWGALGVHLLRDVQPSYMYIFRERGKGGGGGGGVVVVNKESSLSPEINFWLCHWMECLQLKVVSLPLVQCELSWNVM